MKATSLTLARSGRWTHQVTYWDDGVARWDGAETGRMGAWQAVIPRDWFRRAAPLAVVLRSPAPARRGETTIVIDGPDGQARHSANDGRETDSFWILAAVLDGMAAITQWAPLDTTGEVDLSAWAVGVPMTLMQGSCSAAALARPDGVVVLAGSRPATSTRPSLDNNYTEQRAQFEADGAFELRQDRFLLTRHLFFRSPSAAASVIAGSNTNGRHAWRDDAGHSWADLGLDA